MRGLRIGRRRIRAMLSTSTSGRAKPKIALKSRYQGMGGGGRVKGFTTCGVRHGVRWRKDGRVPAEVSRANSSEDASRYLISAAPSTKRRPLQTRPSTTDIGTRASATPHTATPHARLHCTLHSALLGRCPSLHPPAISPDVYRLPPRVPASLTLLAEIFVMHTYTGNMEYSSNKLQYT